MLIPIAARLFMLETMLISLLMVGLVIQLLWVLLVCFR